MYAKNKNYGRRPVKGKGKKKTSKEYAWLAGFKAGLSMARKSSGRYRSKRWY